jgi:DNA primase
MAGRIPDKFIDELLARVDIVDVIDAHVPLRKAGKDYKACCPFHEEKTPSFTVSPDKQFYHCFGCGAHGTAIGFLLEYERLNFPEAVKYLAARVGLTLPTEAQEAAGASDENEKLLAILQQAARYYQRQLREHPQAGAVKDYLKNRGLSGEIAAEFGLGYAPDGWHNLLQALGPDQAAQEALLHAGLVAQKEPGRYYDRFRQRVIFPIHDYRGRIVGFGGRVFGKGEPKYLNSPETPLFHKGRELYGLFRARETLKREQHVLVVEGYMDVVALAQFGINYAVATLGTATTRDHLERLFRHAPEVVFCFDGDRAGREAAWRALETALPVLHDGRQASFLFLPDGEDPDSLVRKEGATGFAERLKAAAPLPEFFLETLSQQVDLDRLDGRARLVELARPLLSKLGQSALRELMVGRLAERSRLEPGNLSTLLFNGDKRADSRRAPTGGVPTRTRRTQPLQAGHRPSLIAMGIGFLLQRPALARELPETDALDRGLLAQLDQPGMALLLELMELLSDDPDLHAGAIIERYKYSKYRDSLVRLATWDGPITHQDISAEFRGLIEGLYEQAIKQATERLYRKENLSSPEKAELQRLTQLQQSLKDKRKAQPA